MAHVKKKNINEADLTRVIVEKEAGKTVLFFRFNVYYTVLDLVHYIDRSTHGFDTL
jgi:hypothetical protein